MRPDEEQLRLASQLLCGQPVDAIFVAHSHHDHALDTARIAREKHAKVYGSDSTRNVLFGKGKQRDSDEHVDSILISDGDCFSVGDFTVKVLSSSHEATTFGPDGEITSPLAVPARLRDIKSGPSFAFLISHRDGDVLIVPSAVMDGNSPVLAGAQADVVLLGVGMLGRESEETMRSYWTSVVCQTQASRVHLIHWDDFTRPLSEPLRPFPPDRFDRTVRVLSSLAQAGGIELSYLPLGTPVAIVRSERRVRSAACPVCPKIKSSQPVPPPAQPAVTQCGRAS